MNHERDRDGDGDLMLLCVGEKECFCVFLRLPSITLVVLF